MVLGKFPVPGRPAGGVRLNIFLSSIVSLFF